MSRTGGRAWAAVRRRAGETTTLVLTLAVLGPLLLGTGYWLTGDMVFVPHQPWKPEWWGGDGGLPRAVPMDALVSAATHLVPGWVVQRMLLLGAFAAGGLGATRLLRALRPAGVAGSGRWAAAEVAGVALWLWNPWVHDRLAMGQWAILAGALVLPHVVVAAGRLRSDGVRAAAPSLLLALGACATCSPSSGVTALAVALVVAWPARGSVRGSVRVWVRGWVRGAIGTAGVVLGLGVLVDLPWLVPALRAGGAGTRIDTAAVFGAFAARGESSLGTLASLLSLGGTWKTAVVAPERTTAVGVGLGLLLTGLAVGGALRARGSAPAPARATRDRLAVLAAGALALALLPVVPGGARALAAAAGVVPGLALLRDSERYLAPAGLLLAVGLADAVVLLVAAARPGRGSLRALAALAVVAPVLLLPSLAWGLLGDLRAVHYPPAWEQVRRTVAAAPAPVTVVLPWRGSYRGFAWDDDRAVLDPAPRYLPGRVVVDDRVLLGDEPGGSDVVVPAESAASRAVDAALTAPTPRQRAAALRALGVRFVLVEGDPASGVVAADLPAGRDVVAGDGLVLRDLGPAAPGAGDPAVTGAPEVGSSGFVALLFTSVLLLCTFTATSVRSIGHTGRRTHPL